MGKLNETGQVLQRRISQHWLITKNALDGICLAMENQLLRKECTIEQHIYMEVKWLTQTRTSVADKISDIPSSPLVQNVCNSHPIWWGWTKHWLCSIIGFQNLTSVRLDLCK